MIDSITALEADLDYAERMVRKGFGTPEQAAHICGIKLQDLLVRLSQRAPNGQPPQKH